MTSARPSSTKGRKARSFAFDPRLAIGVLLVAASIGGVVAIVAAADETVQVYAARAPLAPGDRIEPGDLETRSVRLDAASRLYLVPGDIPQAGFVVTRPVSTGELVPAASVGSVDGLRVTSVVLSVGGALAASVQAGAVVDVWAARALENRSFGPPAVIVSAATVVRLVVSDSIVSSGAATAVELQVPKSKVARLLEALANDDALSIVPANLPGRS